MPALSSTKSSTPAIGVAQRMVPCQPNWGWNDNHVTTKHLVIRNCHSQALAKTAHQAGWVWFPRVYVSIPGCLFCTKQPDSPNHQETPVTSAAQVTQKRLLMCQCQLHVRKCGGDGKYSSVAGFHGPARALKIAYSPLPVHSILGLPLSFIKRKSKPSFQ